MTVRTTKVTGRRRLRFASLDEVLVEAEHLAVIETRQLGNWSLGQALSHLAAVYEKSIDGTVFRPGLFLRLLVKVAGPLLKRWARVGLPAGIRPPAFMFNEVAPADRVSIAEGLVAFRGAIGRLKAESKRDFKQCFNLFTREEWDQFHMRHAELHLSFIVPAEDVS
ncbi:MAG: DUF1569 domain-containing protein [Planctomycetaceae bacterium]|nr:DUF1569 domain-containing protein [Planctomycetaceae bacterium]